MIKTTHPKYSTCIAQVGDRVELIEMTGEDLPRGLLGTITHITTVYDGQLDISVRWDNCSSLNLIYPLDDFKVLGK